MIKVIVMGVTRNTGLDSRHHLRFELGTFQIEDECSNIEG
jgi:hypothetical protein